MAIKQFKDIKEQKILDKKIREYKLDTSNYKRDEMTILERKKYIAYDYINNGYSIKEISKKYGFNGGTHIVYYVNLVLMHGYEVFDNPKYDQKFTVEERERLVKEVLEKGRQATEVSLENKILNQSTLKLWIKKYKEQGKKGLQNNVMDKYRGIVKAKEEGKTYPEIAKIFNSHEGLIRYVWILYKTYGEEVFDELSLRKVYSEKERKEILDYYYANGMKQSETALHFKMRNTTTINSWVKKAEKELEEKIKGANEKSQGRFIRRDFLEDRYKKDLDIALEIQKGIKGRKQISEEYNIKPYIIDHFTRILDKWGIEAFDVKKRIKRTYPEELKEEVVYRVEVLKEKAVLVAAEKKIVNYQVITRWKKFFKIKGIDIAKIGDKKFKHLKNKSKNKYV